MFTQKLILGSNSPRRKQILHDCGFEFNCISPDIDESYSESLIEEQVPMFLARSKAEKILSIYPLQNELVLTADTIVLLDKKILNKPKDKAEAKEMLNDLSGMRHQVITGFAITNGVKFIVDYDLTEVNFKYLSEIEIDFYINKYEPLDKAGAYGVQEFIGMVGISKIEGSFYNVMGLPIHKVYEQLLKF